MFLALTTAKVVLINMPLGWKLNLNLKISIYLHYELINQLIIFQVLFIYKRIELGVIKKTAINWVLLHNVRLPPSLSFTSLNILSLN